MADCALRGALPRDPDLGRLRHGFAAAGGELRVEPIPDAKPGGNRLYFIPDANHYLQLDRPDTFVKVLRHTLQASDEQPPGPLDSELGAALLVDASRERLPAAEDLLRGDGPAAVN